LDLDAQNTARQVMQRRLAELTETRDGEPPREVRNAAVVALNPHSGDVLAMVGSPNYFDPRIDGAVNAALTARQPGSSIKPITYAAAFDPQIAAAHGYAPLTPGTMMVDVRTAFVTKEGRPYVPQNYDRRWHGPVLLRQSLASSFNLIAVKVLDTVGFEAMTELARSLGISTFDNRQFGLALTLGGGEVRLLELTAAYAAFANGGQRIEPVLISRVADSTGRVLYRRPADLNPGPRVLDARTAYLITDILSDDYARRSGFGAGSVLQLDRPAAAKTGTTTDWRDNWTVGYTPNLVVGVWAGNADNEPMRHVSGVTGAAPIWHDVMALLLKGRPAQPFPRPDGLVEREICADNGLLPAKENQGATEITPTSSSILQPSAVPARCPHTLTEIFIDGTEPRRVDDWHIAVALDRRTGLRAGPGCKLDFVTLQTYTRYPAEAEAWARRQGIPQPPDIYSPLCPNPDAESPNRPIPHAAAPSPFSLIFTSPDQGSVYRISPKIPRDKQKIRVAVRPADGVRVARVELRVNGAPLAAGPQTLWQMSPGEFTFEAVGVDPAGNPLPARPVTVRIVE
ncbi:MAG: penicillin-binding protein, partial [Chloroflexi bacterium]